jgi:hypothetical protein
MPPFCQSGIKSIVIGINAIKSSLLKMSKIFKASQNKKRMPPFLGKYLSRLRPDWLVHLTSGLIETWSEVFQVGVPSESTSPFLLPGSASKYYSEPLAYYFDKLA